MSSTRRRLLYWRDSTGMKYNVDFCLFTQDINVDMGPTMVLLGTHKCADAHARFNGSATEKHVGNTNLPLLRLLACSGQSLNLVIGFHQRHFSRSCGLIPSRLSFIFAFFLFPLFAFARPSLQSVPTVMPHCARSCNKKSIFSASIHFARMHALKMRLLLRLK